MLSSSTPQTKRTFIAVVSCLSVLAVIVIVLLSLYFTGNLGPRGKTGPSPPDPSPPDPSPPGPTPVPPPSFSYPDIPPPPGGIYFPSAGYPERVFKPQTTDGSAFPPGVWSMTDNAKKFFGANILLDQNSGNLTVSFSLPFISPGDIIDTVRFTTDGTNYTQTKIKFYH